MNLKELLIIDTMVTGLFGIGFVLAPLKAIQLYDNDPIPPFIYAIQIFWGALFSLAAMTWTARNAANSDAHRAVLLCLFVGTGLGFILSLMAQLRGVVNALGWSSVVIYLLFALDFCNFQFSKSPH